MSAARRDVILSALRASRQDMRAMENERDLILRPAIEAAGKALGAAEKKRNAADDEFDRAEAAHAEKRRLMGERCGEIRVEQLFQDRAARLLVDVELHEAPDFGNIDATLESLRAVAEGIVNDEAGSGGDPVIDLTDEEFEALEGAE